MAVGKSKYTTLLTVDKTPVDDPHPCSRRDLSADASRPATPLAPKTTCHLASNSPRTEDDMPPRQFTQSNALIFSLVRLLAPTHIEIGQKQRFYSQVLCWPGENDGRTGVL